MTGPALLPESEADFQSWVIDLLHAHGYRVHHSRPAPTGRVDRNGKRVWNTPIQGDTGFPDIVAARPGRVIFAELKAEAGTLSPEQREWIAYLETTAVEVYVWRPHQRDEIEAEVRCHE